MSSIFGLRSSYMLEYCWLSALLLRSASCFTGFEGKWTLLPPISPPSSSRSPFYFFNAIVNRNVSLISFFCVLSCGLSLKMFLVRLKRMFVLLVWDEKLLYILVKSIWSRTLFNAPICLLIFCLEDLSIFHNGVLKSPYYDCVAVNIFLEVLQDVLYVFGCSCVRCMYIYNVYVFLMDSSFDPVPSGCLFMALFWSLFCLNEFCYPGFLFLSICSEYVFLSFHFQSV